jgi:hypothetical protein
MKDRKGALVYTRKLKSEKQEDDDMNVTDPGLVLLCSWKVTD